MGKMIIGKIIKKITTDSKDLDVTYQKIIDEDFWDLV